MKRCALFVAWTGLSASAFATSADAATLEWRAPARCPDRAIVAPRWRSLPAASEQEWEVFVHVSEEGARFVARVEVRGPSGVFERALSDTDCDAVAEAALLVAAIAITGDVRAAEEPEPVARPSSDAESSDRRPLDEPEPAVSEDLAFIALATADAHAGTLPNIAFGLSLGIGVQFQDARFEARGRGIPESVGALESSSAAGGVFALWAGELRSCWAPSVDAFAFNVCGFATLGAIRARGFGVSHPADGEDVWFSLGLSGAVVWYLVDTFGLRVEVELAAPTNRSRFALEGIGLVHRSERVVGRIGVGLEVAVR